MNAANLPILVVGAGFAGATCARELADLGFNVFLIDKRSHLAGNAYDEFDSHGILVHRYGPHFFHTNSERVFRWLSRFTDWHFYEHRVLAKVGEYFVPVPINRKTINILCNINADERGVEKYLESVREAHYPVRTSEDVVLNSVGRDLCEKIFRNYTRKQWGLDLSELSPGVAARIPVRVTDDDRYFDDIFQFMPKEGYTRMFEKIIGHPNIKIELNLDYRHIKNKFEFKHTIYTGPIDEFFDFAFGRLPYRSIRFEHEHIANIEKFQPVGTVNFPSEYLYTRITEFKHATGQRHSGTSIVREYPCDEGDPFYPIPRTENESLYKKYRDLSEAQSGVTFVGRLAQYRYYNMDQVVAAAIKSTENLVRRLICE